MTIVHVVLHVLRHISSTGSVKTGSPPSTRYPYIRRTEQDITYSIALTIWEQNWQYWQYTSCPSGAVRLFGREGTPVSRVDRTGSGRRGVLQRSKDLLLYEVAMAVHLTPIAWRPVDITTGTQGVRNTYSETNGGIDDTQGKTISGDVVE